MIPSRTVSFLFTDIEGSPTFWDKHPEAMKQALAVHDTLMRQVIETRGGYVFKTVGDAFCASFATAADALLAAVEIRTALASRLPELAGIAFFEDGHPETGQSPGLTGPGGQGLRRRAGETGRQLCRDVLETGPLLPGRGLRRPS